jgi:hypothetical protein
VVPLLRAAHLHDLGKLEQACIDLIKANLASQDIVDLLSDFQGDHILSGSEVQAALGILADDEENKGEGELSDE